MPSPRALLLENIHPDAARRLADAGFAVSARPAAPSASALAGSLRGISLLGVRSRTKVTASVLAAAPDLLAVGCFCVGTDNVDLAAARDRGVAVFNAPYSNTRSVAELVVGELVMLMRRACDKSRLLHQGVWDKSAAGCREVRGKTLGIIGYGNIGGQVGILAEALGMRVLYYDLVDKLSLGNAARCRSQAEVLRRSDAVTLHVDDAPENAGLIGERQLAAMPRGAFLINASRGRVVDIPALARALRRGRLGGAAVDVFPTEPEGNGKGFRSPLQGLPNVILTPHIGGSTAEAQRNIAADVSEKLHRYVHLGDTYYSVSLPQVQLPVLRRCHRILHIHRNVPGVMSQINTVLAGHGINITGQYLETNEKVGYAITDIARRYDRAVLRALEGIRETIRLRVLF
ncbi:MAG: phosphoglycerate dehydrogenase [Elusimicrobia bacterium]|nr:phosphoglycerate dehydrogenase [Elusimicrobiota bacterium]